MSCATSVQKQEDKETWRCVCTMMMQNTSVNKEEEEEMWSGVYTMMMQNLPSRCTSDEIMAAVQELGFGDYVNYLRVPRNRTGRNGGYGFIGFVTPELTQKFRQVFDGFTLKSRSSSKQVRLKPARQQIQELPGALRVAGHRSQDCLYPNDPCQMLELLGPPPGLTRHESGLLILYPTAAFENVSKDLEVVSPVGSLEQWQGLTQIAGNVKPLADWYLRL
eukprot:TRINITY_DN78705_c0_g1_i1.p1 TRINITY_DN78705_c0_g1~~TRINITY_DN78705_c0_g1_i1.p1  ORF type:complete len:235 (+),score=30.93 TRINITY_DN78705_c0_g1_i1:47-706(+)